MRNVIKVESAYQFRRPTWRRRFGFVERFSQYTPGSNLVTATGGRWVPYLLQTSVVSTDDGGVRVGRLVQAAGNNVGDGVGVVYSWSGGFVGQQTRAVYLAASDVSGARFDTRQPFVITADLTILDQSAPIQECGVTMLNPNTPAGNKSGITFYVGYDVGGYYGRIVDEVNGGGQLTKTSFGPAWVPYGTLIRVTLTGNGNSVSMKIGPAQNLIGSVPNIDTLFIRGGTFGMQFNWNASTVDKNLGMSNLTIQGAYY